MMAREGGRSSGDDETVVTIRDRRMLIRGRTERGGTGDGFLVGGIMAAEDS